MGAEAIADVPCYAFGAFELDLGRFELRQGTTALDLEPKALAVLRLLVQRAPHVVDKAEIFADVWKDTAVSDNALTRIIAQLRKALGDDARDPRYIATISTRGYRLLPAVRRLDSAVPLPDVASVVDRPIAPPAPPVPATIVRWWRRPIAWSMVAAAALVSALGVWLVLPGRTAAPRPSSIGDLDLAVAASLGPQQLTVATAFDGYVAFSPDGTTIAYSSDRSGRLEIYVEGLAEGSTPASLTAGRGQCVQPVWSPDGRLIAYHEMSSKSIWVVPSRGGAARQVADFGAHPSWSPDGRHLVFQSRSPSDFNPGGSFGAESTIWIADADGGAPARPLTLPGRPTGSHGVPQWWPDGRHVVFAVTPPDGGYVGSALWAIAPDGGELRRVIAHPRLTSEFVAAPDGRGVLFAARGTNALWWLPVEGNDLEAGEPRPTALPVTGPLPASLAISPDGRRIAWTAVASSSGIWSAPVDAATGAQPAATSEVPASEVGWRAGNPAVAPDGRIAFLGNRGNAGNNIFLVEPGRAPRQLTTDGRDHYSPFWIQGEDALAVSADHGNGPAWWRLDPATGREQLMFYARDIVQPAGVQSQLLGPAMSTTISADLRHLAVAYVRDGVPNLWTSSLSPRGPAGPLVQRTFEAINGSFASWSPDGRWLAYQCTRGGSPQLCAVAAEGTSPPQQLTHEAGTHFIGQWQDDDRLLFAVKRQAVWNVMSVSRVDGTERALSAFAEPRFYVRYPRWDLPRRRVVFERWETTGRLWSVRLPAVSAAGSPASRPGH